MLPVLVSRHQYNYKRSLSVQLCMCITTTNRHFSKIFLFTHAGYFQLSNAEQHINNQCKYSLK